MKKRDKNMSRFTYPLTFKKASTPNIYDKRLVLLQEETARFDALVPDDEQSTPLDTDSFLDSLKLNNIIIGKTLMHVNISNRQFDELILIDCSATTFVARETKINKLFLIRTDITSADFSGAQIPNVTLSKVKAANSRFQGAVLSHGWLDGNFEKSIFDEVDMHESVLTGNFQEVSFQKANVVNCWICNGDIRNANFLEAKVDGLKLDLVYTGHNSIILPDGSFYDLLNNSFDDYIKRSN
jgi:uncharacterized protein YjbI with pentapeptide repeats